MAANELEQYLEYVKDKLNSEVHDCFLENIECSSVDSYMEHLRIMAGLAEKWGLMEAGSEYSRYIPGLVAFHGFDSSDLPEEMKTGKLFNQLHEELRRLVIQHERVVSQSGSGSLYLGLQKAINDIAKRNTVILALFIANSMSLFMQAAPYGRSSLRLRNAAGFFLEVLESMALEKGIFLDAKKCADRAISVFNPRTHHALKKRIEDCEKLGAELSERVNTEFEKNGFTDVRFSFSKHYVHSVARRLGVLYNYDPNIIQSCHFCDLGQIVCDCIDRRRVFTVLERLLARFPDSEYRIKDFIALPKPSGYMGLHIVLPMWLRYEDKSLQICDAEDPFAERQYVKIALLLPQGTDVIRGKENIQWIQSGLALKDNFITVYTRNNEPARMPKGATLLDFAFRLHTEIGLQCGGGTVSNSSSLWQEKHRDMDYVLREGDIIDISIASKSPGPTPRWLECCKTANARDKIRNAIRSKRVGEQFKNIVDIKLIAYDRKGLTETIAREIANRNLYAVYFFGRSLRDGRAGFHFRLFLTANEMDYYINRKDLINTFERHPDVLYVQQVRHWRFSQKLGQILGNEESGADWGGGLRDFAFFSGRKRTMNQLRDWFNNQQTPSCAVSGFYRAGKTLLCAQFANELDNTVTFYINMSRIGHVKTDTEFWRNMYQETYRAAAYGLQMRLMLPSFDASHTESGYLNLCRFIIKIANNVYRGRCLFIFDDVDVLDMIHAQMMSNNLMRIIKLLKDEIFFDFQANYSPKFLFVGQYRLYRLLKREGKTAPLVHIPLKRFIDRGACITYVKKRFQYYCTNFPGTNFLYNYAERIVSLVGFSPQNLSNFVDLLFKTIAGVDMDKISDKEDFMEKKMQSIFFMPFNDKNLQSELFEQLINHYLMNPENRLIRDMLDSLTKAGNRGINQEEMRSLLNDPETFNEALDELIDFGFVKEENNQENNQEKRKRTLNLLNTWTTNFLCHYFSHPLFRK